MKHRVVGLGLAVVVLVAVAPTVFGGTAPAAFTTFDGKVSEIVSYFTSTAFRYASLVAAVAAGAVIMFLRSQGAMGTAGGTVAKLVGGVALGASAASLVAGLGAQAAMLPM